MKKIKHDRQRPYKLAHQTLCITGINFEQESVVGYVELALHPLTTELRRIKINSKQCRIYRICINDQWEASFLYNDPTLEICQGEAKQRNLDFFQNCHLMAMNAVDPDHANGEVTVKLPPEAHSVILDGRPLRVCVEFSIEKPKGGLHFVIPKENGKIVEKAAHVFTSGRENASRLWFPCLDTYSEPCTWKLEYTVEPNMTAVSCGDLIECVYTQDMKKKTFHYFLSTPTSAPNIALAVGAFEILVDPSMHEVTHFCLPHLKGILKHTTSYLHEAFEFYEELLSSSYPYNCYKQVFVDETYEDQVTYATMTIFSTNLLHSAHIIDQTFITRKLMAAAVAEQFFGCFIQTQSWCDSWLTKGIAGYLSSLFSKHVFGNNEYRTTISKLMKKVCDYEHKEGGIILDPSKKDSNLHFSLKHQQVVSPKYLEIFIIKAQLVIRLLEVRIGRELILQVFNKLLSLALSASQQKFLSNSWSNMLLSTGSFLKILSNVTGKDIQPFIDQWVSQGGCATFNGSFVFNRKRNVVELEIKQDNISKGTLKYVGPLTVTIQELDGSFSHNFKIEENKTKFEITCHSKSRRNKKKKIPLLTGEEVDMDLNAMDADSPVLWLRVDPDMNLVRHVNWEQPDYMWQYQLKYERDVIAQFESIYALEKFPTPQTRMALTDIIESDQYFYKVRMEACVCIAKVANHMVASWTGPPAMMTIFKHKLFGSRCCPAIIRQNNFTNFQHYFLLMTIPYAMAHLRTIHNICPSEVFRFILDLFKYNDNSKNKYSDNYYRAILIDSLASTVTPAITTVTTTGQKPSTEMLTGDTKLILDEITRCLNLEKLLPCYRHTVTVSCLRAFRTLQNYGHLPSESTLFKSYAEYGVFRDVRIAAIEGLVDYIKVESNSADLNWLLDFVEKDPDHCVRLKILRLLVENPPFKKNDKCPVNTEQLVERLWKLMNTGLSHDSRLRCSVADFYYTLYGRTRPTCLPIPDNVVVLNLKEKKAKFSPSIVPEKISLKEKKPIMLNPSVIPEKLGDIFNDEEEDHPLNRSAPEEGEIVDVIQVKHLENSSGGIKRKADSPPLEPTPQLVSVSKPELKIEISSENFVSKVKIKDPDDDVQSKEPKTNSNPVTPVQLNPPTPSLSIPPNIIPVFPVERESIKLSDDSDSSPIHPGMSQVSQDSQSSVSQSATVSLSQSFTQLPTPSQSFTDFSQKSILEGDDSSKHHKTKKKKKKNKHKHKHKHKHDRHDKEKSEKDKSDRPNSSENSNLNSPAIQQAPSSPEFEVM